MTKSNITRRGMIGGTAAGLVAASASGGIIGAARAQAAPNTAAAEWPAANQIQFEAIA